MKKIFTTALLILLAPTFAFCAEKISDWSCEKLIEKANDKDFSLNVLAGLRAHKNCKNFKYDWKSLSDTDKKIYSDELMDIDPDYKLPLAELSIKDLKQKLSAEKDPQEKFKIYKQIRQKYKNNGAKNDSKRIILQIHKWAESILKYKKNKKKQKNKKSKENRKKKKKKKN